MSSPPPPPSKEHIRATVVYALVGAVVGALTVSTIAVVFFMWYRNKKKREMEILRGGHPPSPTKNGQNPPALADNVKLMRKPDASPTVFEDSHVSSPAFTASDPHLTSGSLGSEKCRHSPSPSMCGWLAENTFTYEELEKATGGFTEENFLGQGGFGYVHKGVLDNGKAVAVKQLKPESRQGEREFHAEIGIISRVQHPHLVSLLGYCINGSHSLLVYEFVPNNNLEFHLHGKDNPTISWSTRMKIALGAAKGLAFLHEDCQPKIIHRDVKASNILLDDNFEAKVSDFGLAKDFADSDTHVSTRVVGTFGYMAPEYAATGKLTHKSDVFSFGVVLLELITGRPPVVKASSENAVSIVDWAAVQVGEFSPTLISSLQNLQSRPLIKQALEDGNCEPVVDPKLLKQYNRGEMTRMIACAATCVDYSAKLRPRMSQIVRTLEGHMPLDDVIEGTPKMDNRPDRSRENMKALWMTALGSFGSSEYNVPTSEGHQAARSSSRRQQATLQIEPSKSEKRTKDSFEC